jgi:hypothetical protein
MMVGRLSGEGRVDARANVNEFCGRHSAVKRIAFVEGSAGNRRSRVGQRYKNTMTGTAMNSGNKAAHNVVDCLICEAA